MKKYLLIVLLFFVCSAGIKSQTKADTKDAINTQRVELISSRLKLTTDEAEKFWPVFNEFEQKKEDLRIERVKAKKKLAADKDNKLTEKEIEVLIDAEMDYHQKETTLTKERHQRLKKILSMRKIALLYQAEEDFKKILIKKACENLNQPKKGAGED
jgi:hypothetical protein